MLMRDLPVLDDLMCSEYHLLETRATGNVLDCGILERLVFMTTKQPL